MYKEISGVFYWRNKVEGSRLSELKSFRKVLIDIHITGKLGLRKGMWLCIFIAEGPFNGIEKVLGVFLKNGLRKPFSEEDKKIRA